MGGPIPTDLKPGEGSIEVHEEDLQILAKSLDPRKVTAALKKFRFIARTEALQHRFIEAEGLLYVMTCLTRYMWNPAVCREACNLLGGFTAQHSCHAQLIREGVLDVLFSLTLTHSKPALENEEEVEILLTAVEAVANFTSNEDKAIRKSCVEKGAERMSALVNDVILKENKTLTPSQIHRLQLNGHRLRANLEKLCHADSWDAMGKRNQRYWLKKEVYPMTKRGDPTWKPPK
mmetsp:Transcript_3083/g.7144  ORF Transcript_3083/g.7144 Transcript_3083/m.7144 type:complete len:233 (+) Transcript_3083:37-735(+)|eukprot:CAMPEP_0178981752 /NCGR_PEP_ID=MMETSP0795-20121207/114_1 /TAXON_ID=88552 /ORGANISM="Amoebophrya sp., Strain Ameob2" /LENGTH=232 /DNA_ID=CAMNT_0020672319 /DNA_START=98 /DNA_END=796 /DNA_ORIENTATION=+